MSCSSQRFRPGGHFAVSLLVGCLGACGGGGGGRGGQEGGSAGGASPLGTNLRGSVQVDAYSFSLEFSRPDLVSVTLVEPEVRAATRFEGKLYLLDLPLAPGTGRLRFEGLAAGGEHLTEELTVVRAALPGLALVANATPRVVIPGDPVWLELAHDPSLTVVEVLVDQEGDGTLDYRTTPGSSITAAFSDAGWYRPSVTLRTANGLLLTTAAEHRSEVACLPSRAPTAVGLLLPNVPDIADLEWDQEEQVVVALTLSGSIHRVRLDGSALPSIPVEGADSPEGLCLDGARNIYVADTGNHRVVRLSAVNGYAPDRSFGDGGSLGSFGAGAGEFDGPRDIAAVRVAGTLEWRLAVADTGNGRVQVFDESGAVVAVWRGDEAGGLSFTSIGRLVSAHGVGVGALDEGAARVRIFDLGGVEREHWGDGNLPGEPALIAPTGLWQDPLSGAYVVVDGATRIIHVYGANDAIRRSWDLGIPPRLALVVQDSSRELLLVVDAAGGAGIGVYDCASDPPGWSAPEVVDHAVAALLAGNSGELAGRMNADLATFLTDVLADPDAGPALQARLVALHPAQPESLRSPYAVVRSPDPTHGEDLRWLLRRNRGEGRWTIVSL